MQIILLINICLPVSKFTILAHRNHFHNLLHSIFLPILILCSLPDSDGYEFSLVSLDNKQWHFEAASQEDRDEWVTVIEQQILCSLQGNESNKSRTRQAHPIDPQAIITIKNQVPGNLNCVDCDAPSEYCRKNDLFSCHCNVEKIYNVNFALF